MGYLNRLNTYVRMYYTDPPDQQPRGQRDLRHAGRLRGGEHAPRVRPWRGGEHERTRPKRTPWQVSSSY